MSDVTTPPRLQKLGGTPPLKDYVSQVWRRREFAWSVAQGEIRAQHLDTALGNLWHLLNPLLQIGVYYLVFGVILGTDRGVENFIAFLAVGIFTFTFMQKSIMSGASTLVGKQGLIRSLQFPRALLPLSATMREAMAFGPAVVIMLVVVLVTGEPVRAGWVLVLPALVLAAVFAAGFSFIGARLADRFRDLLNVLPFLFRIAFYLSGVLYSVDAYIESPLALRLLLLNPFYVFVSLPREYLMVTQSHDFVGWLWVSATVWAILSAIVGVMVFRGGEREYGRG